MKRIHDKIFGYYILVINGRYRVVRFWNRENYRYLRYLNGWGL